jgi:hypothetical protein
MLLKYWKQLLLAVLLSVTIGSASYSIYHKIYNAGVAEATTKYEKQIGEFNKQLSDRITNIENISDSIETKLVLQRADNKKEFASILASVKGKPSYTIVDGKCAPSVDFIKAYNDAINKANK